MPIKKSKTKPKRKVGGRYKILPIAPRKGLVKRKPQKANKIKRKRKK